MDKVITINDWWDGPKLGLAYFENTVCIYERIFDEIKDDWIDEYYLTPISDDEEIQIMSEWEEWCEAVAADGLEAFYANKKHVIDIVLEAHELKRRFRKRAVFKGEYEMGWIPVDYHVEWKD